MAYNYYFKKTMNLYTYKDAEKLMNHYIEKGGDVYVLDEGSLVYGLVVCTGEGLKTAVIKEVYQNCWSSLQSIRLYNKLPKKYERMIDDWCESH